MKRREELTGKSGHPLWPDSDFSTGRSLRIFDAGHLFSRCTRHVARPSRSRTDSCGLETGNFQTRKSRDEGIYIPIRMRCFELFMTLSRVAWFWSVTTCICAPTDVVKSDIYKKRCQGQSTAVDIERHEDPRSLRRNEWESQMFAYVLQIPSKRSEFSTISRKPKVSVRRHLFKILSNLLQRIQIRILFKGFHFITSSDFRETGEDFEISIVVI